jgi:hypothetical protein
MAIVTIQVDTMDQESVFHAFVAIQALVFWYQPKDKKGGVDDKAHSSEGQRTK